MLWVLILASVVQCLERHDVPALPGVVPGGVWGACGCSVVFVGGFSGGVTPGPFPNPEAKPACADGTAPGRVWESRSPPTFALEQENMVCWCVVRAGPPFGRGRGRATHSFHMRMRIKPQNGRRI